MKAKYQHMIDLRADEQQLLEKLQEKGVKIIEVMRKGLEVKAREEGIK